MRKELFLKLAGLVLLAAAYPKVRHPLSFRIALESYSIFPAASLSALQVLVPCLEIVLGLSLLAKPTRLSMLLSAGLFASFAIVLGLASARGDYLICGCFGRVDLFLHKLPHGLALHIFLNAMACLGLLAVLVRGSDGNSGSQRSTA
jgi:hypothetical protein